LSCYRLTAACDGIEPVGKKPSAFSQNPKAES
jgi:hypothetical protein